MQFYSGFSLENESNFFTPYLQESDFTIAGFSYGAIKAFEEGYARVSEGLRVDRIQLLSPAFFQTKSEKFKRLQLMGYTRNTQEYLDAFLQLCFAPYGVESVQHATTSKEQLEELLYYKWEKKLLKELQKSGVEIEVYLGGKDAIIDAKKAKEFFIDVATVTYIKEANHFLQIN
jgi:hypothetical protein